MNDDHSYKINKVWPNITVNFFITLFSRLIQNTVTCSTYECFILSVVKSFDQFLGQRYVKELFKRLLESFMVDKGILSNNMKSPSPECNITF